MVTPWRGARRVAVVPVFDRNVDRIPPPADWDYQVRARTLHEPDPASGEDGSFQNYLQAVSSGTAFLEAEFFPRVVADDADVLGAAARSLPSGHGHTHLLAVLPHSFGQHRGGFAQWGLSPVNGITAMSRVALFDNPQLTLRQPIGVWAMELFHAITGLGDLYNVNPALGPYDVMSSAGATTHPSAHTKNLFGWLPRAAFIEHGSGRRSYQLQAIAMPQPAPPGQASAVRVSSRTSHTHFVIESRRRVDAYERQDGTFDGIPREGVIVYEVETDTRVFLRTSAALSDGQSYSNPAEGLTVRVTSTRTDGHTVQVDRAASPQCPALEQAIELLQESVREERDPFVRRLLLQELARKRAEARRLGCR
ncbi:MAG: hypothetical protein R3E10_13290 [Gemmatimonadota bacterium]